MGFGGLFKRFGGAVKPAAKRGLGGVVKPMAGAVQQAGAQWAVQPKKAFSGLKASFGRRI